MPASPQESARHGGFSLVELLMAIVVTLTLVLMVVRMVDLASRAWKGASENSRAFQGARVAFETVTRTLSQATLSAEYDYYNAALESRQYLASSPDGVTALRNFVPHVYGRYSGLHFISGADLIERQHTHALFFQTLADFDIPRLPAEGEEDEPLSGPGPYPSGMLNAVGFFIRHENDSNERPTTIPAGAVPLRARFRLLMYFQPSSELDVYRLHGENAWFSDQLDDNPPEHVRLLAENIVLLAILPKAPGQPVATFAPGYQYDSRTPWESGVQPIQQHQLPPLVEVVMVAVDESAFVRDSGLGEELEGAFTDLFSDPRELDGDLSALEARLTDMKLNYRVFRTEVPLRSAKWNP